MKTYESEEKVNNSYELELDSYRNIGVAELYGLGWTGWIVKTAINIGVGFVWGPVAVPLGLTVWVGDKLIQNISDNDDVKKVSGFIGDVGFDAFLGVITGGVAEVIGESIGASAKETAKVVSKHTDKVVGKAAGKWAAKEIAKGGQKEFYVATARATTKVMRKSSAKVCIEVGKIGGKLVEGLINFGFTADEAWTHLKHL